MSESCREHGISAASAHISFANFVGFLSLSYPIGIKQKYPAAYQDYCVYFKLHLCPSFWLRLQLQPYIVLNVLYRFFNKEE